jgi:hypothetical protein
MVVPRPILEEKDLIGIGLAPFAENRFDPLTGCLRAFSMEISLALTMPDFVAGVLTAAWLTIDCLLIAMRSILD